MVAPILLAAGRSVLTFAPRAASLTASGISSITSAIGGATESAGEFAKEFFEVSRGLESIIEIATGIYDTFLGANERMNQSLLKSQTIIAKSLQSYDLQGNQIDDLRTKIESFGSALKKQRKVLEQDTKEIPGVTSEFTLDVFDETLQRFNRLQGQTKEYGSDLEGITKLAGNLTASLSALNLTDSTQLAQETRSLLEGDVNNPDSTLAKSIGITREEFNQAKASGKLIDVLNEKLAPFREGAALGALSIGNELENITDAIQIFTRTIGDGFSEPVARALRTFRESLEAALTNEELIEKSKEILRTVIDAASRGITLLIDLSKDLNRLGIFDALLDIGQVLATAMEAIVATLQGARNSIVGIFDSIGRKIDWLIEKWNLLGKLPGFDAPALPSSSSTPPPSPSPSSNSTSVSSSSTSVSVSNTPVFSEAEVDLIINKESVERELGLVRTLIGSFGDAARQTIDLFTLNKLELQEGAVERSAEVLSVFSKAARNTGSEIDQLAQKFKESAKASEELSANTDLQNNLEGISDFSDVKGNTQTDTSRVANLTKLNETIDNSSLANREEIQKNIAKFTELEQEASLSNVKTRQDLALIIRTQIQTGTTGVDKLADDTNRVLEQAKTDLVELERLRNSTFGAENAVQLETEIAEAKKRITQITELAQISGLTDVITSQNTIDSIGEISEQIESELNASLSNIQLGVTQDDFSQGIEGFLTNVEEGVNRTVLEADKAKELLAQIAEDNRATFQQRIEAEQKLTRIIQQQAQLRIDAIQTERSAINTSVSIGQISETEGANKLASLDVDEAIEERTALQQELDQLLRISEGIETSAVKSLRERISQSTDSITQLRATEITTAYQSAITELQQEAEVLSQFSQQAEQRIESRQLSNRTSGSLDEDAELTSEIERRNLLKITIKETRDELKELQSLQAGLSQTEQLEHEITIRNKLIELTDQENQLAQQNLQIEQISNQLTIQRIEEKVQEATSLQELADLQERINANDDESVIYAQTVKRLKLEQIQIAEQLFQLSLLDAKTASEQEIFDNKRLALQKQFLENELAQKQELNKLEQQKQDLANRATTIAKNGFSLDNRQLSIEQDKLNLLQEQTKELQDQLKEKAKLAKADVKDSDDKIKSLESELDRLVEEGKAPREARERQKAEKERKNRIEGRFISNRLNGSAEEQNIKQQLIIANEAKQAAQRRQKAVEKEQALAAKEEARLKKEQEVKEQEIKANKAQSSGLDIADQLKELNQDAEKLNTREQTLKEKGLLTEDEKANIDTERNLINQEVGQLIQERKLDREEAGIGKQSIDTVISEQANTVKEILSDSSKVATELADTMSIANATISISNANIQGLSNMMQSSVANGKSAIADTAQSSGSVASPAIDVAASTSVPPSVSNAFTDQSTDNVNITNNWGSLLDQRALARTRGI